MDLGTLEAPAAEQGSREAVERSSRVRGEPEWLIGQRLESWDSFEATPMPSRTDEEWRRTDIRKLRLESLQPAAPTSSDQAESPLGLSGGAYGGVLIQQNGTVARAELTGQLRESGVIFCGLAEAADRYPDLVRDHLMTRAVSPSYGKFAAFNGASWTGGVFLYVPDGLDVSLPLRSLYGLTGGGSVLFPHTLVVLGDRARLTYVEEYASQPAAEQSLSAGVSEIFLGQEAHLTMVSLQEYGSNVYDFNSQRALLERDASLDWLVVGLGSGVTKSNIDVALQGPGARTQMLGVLWGYGHAHTDYQTLQDHQAPNCSSDLLYKGALTDEAVSVFSGKIRVEKGAQRTDSYQANRTVILSEKAAAYPSPNLEIEANDVRCTHGASVGRVDAEQLFYLRSRGLSEELATKMIVEGFFEEVLEREPGASVRENLRDLIRRKIEERAA